MPGGSPREFEWRVVHGEVSLDGVEDSAGGTTPRLLAAVDLPRKGLQSLARGNKRPSMMTNGGRASLPTTVTPSLYDPRVGFKVFFKTPACLDRRALLAP